MSKSNVSHVTCGYKESEYLIQDGRQSGHILQFWGILIKSFILKYNCFSLCQSCLVTYIMFFSMFLIDFFLLHSHTMSASLKSSGIFVKTR